MLSSLEQFASKSIAFLVILIFVAGSSRAKDVSLSEVPAAAKAAIEREAKGFKIGDIEQDTDNGKVVFEVDIDKNGDKEIKLKVADDGTLLEIEEELNNDEVPAVVLSAAKKSLGDLEIGDIEKRYRPGRNTFYRIEAETDDLDIELEIAEDGTILSKETDEKEDDNVPSNFRRLRRTFMQLRCQLKLVAIGDSRTENGVDPQYFFGPENKKKPVAFNFGYSASTISRAQVLVEDYFVHGPKMEWVIYGLSPRVLNKYYQFFSNEEEIRDSRNYRKDKANWAKLPKSSEFIPFDQVIKRDGNPWGYDGKEGVEEDLTKGNDKREALRDLSGGRYEFDTKRFAVIESMIKTSAKHNVNLLFFSPPMHPVSIGQPSTDDDGTTREAYEEYVAKLRALDKKYANFYFLDVNNKGEHGFEPECFRDFDHLNTRGGKKLSLMLNDLIKSVDFNKQSGSRKSVVHK